MPESELEPGAQFSATLERRPGSTAVVSAAGDLDLLTAPRLEALLEGLAGEAGDVVLDLSGLDFIDSTGIHLILRAVRALRGEGREVTIAGAGPEIVRAFELVGLVDHLPFEGRGRSTS